MGKIVITSSVKRAYAPDVVNFGIHICSVADEGAELTRYNKGVIDGIIEGMRALNIDEDALKETAFRIGINREYIDGKYVDKGYRLDSSYELSTYIDYELMGSIRDMLNGLGVEFQVSYSLEDESDIRDALLEEAVGKSKEKAKLIARAGDMQVGEMKEVRYVDNIGNAPMLLRASAKPTNEATPTDVELEESVEVEWEIKAL